MLHILALARNFISISKMGDVGVHTIFEKDTCNMVCRAMVLMREIRIKTLYNLLGRTNINSCLPVVDPKTGEISSCVVNSTMLWHRRLGHIGKKGLHAMHSKCMVEGSPDCSSEFDLCEHYVYRKQNSVSFPSKDARAKIILEVVHSDVFGPFLVPSLGGSRYYVSFINDFPKMTWIYFIKKKSEVFEKVL